jgi:hypothetical protein
MGEINLSGQEAIRGTKTGWSKSLLVDQTANTADRKTNSECKLIIFPLSAGRGRINYGDVGNKTTMKKG